jgi:hypothetical protein
MASIKGGSTKVPGPSSPSGGFVLGSRPGVLRAPPLARPKAAPAAGGIKPGAASTRNYAKPSPTTPFGNLGGGDTNMSGMT